MADYGRVAWQQGEPVVTADGETGRVAWQQGEPVVTGPGTARVAFHQGEVSIEPVPVFRVATVFAEAFIVPRGLPDAPSLEEKETQVGLRSRTRVLR